MLDYVSDKQKQGKEVILWEPGSDFCLSLIALLANKNHISPGQGITVKFE